MQVINVTQGSAEWLALRTQHNTASEAPAMMGVSKYQTRSELLHQKSTGLTPEVSRHMQAIFDRGHSTEAAARVLVEEVLGEELFPVTALSDDGTLLASYDGLTMDDSTGYEHKLWNEALAVQVRAGQLDPHYYWQLEQQILVGKLEKVIFVTSDGTPDNFESMEYFPVAGRAEQLVAGWTQFNADLAAYVPPEAAAPAPSGRAPVTLPALLITVKGEVTASNLAEFKQTALTAIRSVNRELTTDQHFADAEKAVKWCDDIEKRVAGAKQHALSQTATIDQLFKAMDDISAEARQVRLDLDRLVKARKVSLKTELLTEAQTALREHVAALNTRLGKPYMPAITADFAGAIHGKKNFDSMRAALNAALANAKIETNATADRIQANLTTLRELASAHAFLFADTSTIVLKACDDLTALVKTRIAEHAAAELAKEEATRERIRAEEQAKAEAAARAKVLAEQEAERAEAQRMSAIQAQAEKVAADFAAQQKAPQIIQEIIQAAPAVEYIAVPAIETIAPARNVVSIVRAPAVAPTAPATPLTLKLGQIGERLGFNLTGDFLKTLGFEPAARDKSALLFHEASFPLICAALVAHIEQVQAKQAA